MKRSLCLFLLSVPTLQNAGAQNLAKSWKQDIGVMADVNISGSADDFSLFGIQYEWWKNKTVGYRLEAGAGQWYRTGNRSFLPVIKQDTFYSTRKDEHISMAVIGGSLLAHRQFVGKLWLYAGAGLRIGYGTGCIDTTRTTYSHVSSPSFGEEVSARSQGSQSPSSTAVWAGFSPLFGIKLKLNRLWIGTEFTSMVQYTSLARGAGGSYSSDISFYLGQLNERFYLAFSF